VQINKASEWVALLGGVLGIVVVVAGVAVWLLKVSIKEQVEAQLLVIDGPEQAPAFITMQSDVAHLKSGQENLTVTTNKIYDKLLEIAERNANR
jgi:hypothetical protein